MVHEIICITLKTFSLSLCWHHRNDNEARNITPFFCKFFFLASKILNFAIPHFWKLRPPETLRRIAEGKISAMSPEKISETGSDRMKFITNIEDLKDCWKFGAKVLDRIIFVLANAILYLMIIVYILPPLFSTF